MNVDFNNRVIEFWRWFESISNELLLNQTRTDIIAQVDNQIAKLGSFDWEIGPFNKTASYFAISPNLDYKKLEYTRQIIALAPESEGWYFLPSKPPKQWNGIWKMKNEFGQEILVDSGNWEYILDEFDDKTFDIDILIDGVDGNLNTCYLAVDIAMTGYLGEEEFMKLIKNIKFLTELDDGIKSRLTKLKFIKKHIESVV